ncbi:RAMP superfamily CRISPR-associated protein [Enterocloster asparagiformis]|uniref:RAMP superfamily CRISPR-associated protein n=1 Tax=Enterocloster asparagiformis TaxID=333367 RepID=UPI002A80FB52|nr:RAMP superfamily CRISPR-associated protein [Enterocloster asparagiformis]
MKRWWLEITLKSDLCAATGDSEQAVTNMKTALEHGLPIIPAKRLKGCLLNEGKEIVSNGFAAQSELADLFGRPGASHPARLHIGDAHIYRIPGFLLGKERADGDVVFENYEKELRELIRHPELSEDLAERLLTRLRTRTAIDKELKTAQKTTLRTMQVVPRGIVFRSLLELSDAQGQTPPQLLKWCVKALRHVGLGITRGYGEVSCTLTEYVAHEQDAAKDSGIPKDFPGENAMEYEIELQNPVLFSGSRGLYEDCCDYIPGSAIMGALAAMYIADHGLGADAHRDEAFSRIFLRDGVRFGNGFLKAAAGGRDRTFYPAPAFLALEKRGEGRLINRLNGDDEKKRRKELSGQTAFDWGDGKVYLADVEKEVRLHHQRPKDRGIGHAVNDLIQAGAVDMGQFFSYMCISGGQRFSGVIRGNAGDLRELAACLEKRDWNLRLGRSRTAEYGNARIRLFPAGSGQQEAISDRWVLWLLSPMVFVGEGCPGETPEQEHLERQIRNRLGCSVEIRDTILKYTRIGGYNGKWNLPLPQHIALAPGSVICIKTGEKLCASQLEAEFWGDMAGRGCGQVKALPWEEIPESMKNYHKIAVDSREAVEKDELAAQGILVSELEAYRERENQREAQRREAMSIQASLPSAVTIEQLIALMEGHEEYSYTELKREIDMIRDEQKKLKTQEFLKPCEGKTHEFIYFYLLNSKWSARGEAAGNGKQRK